MPKKTLNKTTNEKDKKSAQVKNLVRSIIFSPIFNVAALVLLLVCVFGGLRLLSARQTQGQVKFIERPNLETGDKINEDRTFTSPEVFKGEVYDTSIRLRETGALGMAISLSVFAINQEQGNVPPNLDRIWILISERKLMPPGLKFENGELISPSGTITVRYQSQPLRFEILSRSKQDSGSPAILLRFPLTSLDGRTITYFQSASTGRFDIPAPFSPLEKIVSAGWTMEQWRGELLPKNENARRYLEEEKRLLDQFKSSQ
ncbi:MAG TPA: hypothetical protein PKE69_01285 [Pyrinomonadaceae bacterium]|nr:hypothetical protein [Pyrinomonadaceae bacterium]